jgi:hypothetical protein
MPAPHLASAQLAPLAQTILVLGDFRKERITPATVAAEYGFRVTELNSMAELEPACPAPCAILLHENADEAGCLKCLLLISERFPNAKVVLCRRFREAAFETPAELTALRVFLTLRLPLQHSELRQALGFIWAGANAVDADRIPEQLASMTRTLRKEAQTETAHQQDPVAKTVAS